jgi:peptidoglycan hydrolase-like protein with peptidoglycan-binding domain
MTKWMNARALTLAALLLIAAPAAAANATEPTAADVKKFDAEIATMRREQPDQYRGLVWVVQMALGAFGFGTGPFDGVLDAKTQAAIRQYQRIRQLPQTGDLDFKTVSSITDDHETLVRKYPPYLPHLYIHTEGWDQGYTSARGTWTIVGERLAGIPVQTSQIQCNKARGVCIEATAELSSNVLIVDTIVHPIERWDQHEITTKPVESALCVRYSLRIGRREKTVTGLRLRTVDFAGCEHLATELQLKLVDGHEVWSKLYEDRGARLKDLIQIPAWATR